MSELMKTIRATMKQKNISQRDMAHRVGCTSVSISRWFNGDRFPSLVTLERIAKELDMELVLQARNPRWIHENDDQFDWCVCSECGYGNEGDCEDGDIDGGKLFHADSSLVLLVDND